ncbi:MAG TPA: SEC-C metal-binding domain-containing protein [Kofleriaceae bacterium]
MSAADHVVTAEDVERTIAAFTRLDQRGDRKAMNKLAQRLQKEQPNLLQHAAATKNEHGDTVGEAAVFYATLVWAMFDRRREGTLPRITAQNLSVADDSVTQALQTVPNADSLPAHERMPRVLQEAQPNIYAKLASLLEEDVKEGAMTDETAKTIIKPTQVVIEAFDAALSGRRPGQQQGTLVNTAKVGRNEPCPCGSGKKFKKCHGVDA